MEIPFLIHGPKMDVYGIGIEKRTDIESVECEANRLIMRKLVCSPLNKIQTRKIDDFFHAKILIDVRFIMKFHPH